MYSTLILLQGLRSLVSEAAKHPPLRTLSFVPMMQDPSHILVSEMNRRSAQGYCAGMPFSVFLFLYAQPSGPGGMFAVVRRGWRQLAVPGGNF
jgi:hypothetical protein